ncbi:clostripain-related cysteine peptidase, partial [Thermotoga sp.]|uniref:clostripain-related cysteine peptidase n=1 Tax=Thermotoga sp. TaxID=28240 RepID=UPI0025DC99B0
IGDSGYISAKVVGIDNSQGTAIAIADLRKALENALSGSKLDILGFDACLIGSLEVIYELRNVANYIVASSFEEPAEGWDYTFLSEIEPTSSASEVAISIVDYYRDFYSAEGSREDGLSLAVYKTLQVEEFVSDLNSFISDLEADLNKVDAIYSDVVKCYIDNYNRPVLVDLGNFIDEWVSRGIVSTPDLSSVVVYSYGEIDGQTLSFPISIFMPENMSCYRTYQADYQTLSFPSDTQWDEFLEYWLGIL